MDSGFVFSMCCCAPPPGPWFDLLVFTAGPTAGNRSGYFGGPAGVLTGLRKLGSTTVPYGFTDDGLNTVDSELAFDRYGTDGGRSWADGEPPYRFDLQGVLQDLVDAADAYAGNPATGYKCAWVAAMFDRDGAGSWAICETDVYRGSFEGDTTLGGKRRTWCKLDANGEVVGSLDTVKDRDILLWESAGNNPGRPDRPWRGFAHYFQSGATVAWSAEILAQYNGTTVTTFDGDEGLNDQRIETATRQYISDAGGVFYLPGVDRYYEEITTVERYPGTGSNQYIQTDAFITIRAANSGPSSTTAYTGGLGGIHASVVTPSPYYPKALVSNRLTPTIEFIDDCFIPGPIVEPVFFTTHTRWSLITQTTEFGFGQRIPPGRNAEIDTVLNSYITTPANTSGSGGLPSIHLVDGSPVADSAAAQAICPVGFEAYQATDSADFVIYGTGGCRSVEITDHTEVYNSYWDFQQVDDVELTYTWESGVWMLRLDADEVEIHRQNILGVEYHLDGFGDFTSGGEDIFEIDITTTAGRPLRTLNMAAPAYTPGDYQYGSLSSASFHLFPGEPLTGEAKMAVVYPWDGPSYTGADIMLMTDPETIIAVYRVHAAIVDPEEDPPAITVHGVTSQGIYFNSTFAFRDGKGTIAIGPPDPVTGKWERAPLHPANGANAAGTSFSSSRETVAEQQLIRYGNPDGQTFIDKSYATDTAAQWVGF
jgi:hypothetical protein